MVPNNIHYSRARISYAASDLLADGSRFLFMFSGKSIIRRYKLTGAGTVVYDNYEYVIPYEASTPNQSSELELIPMPGGGWRIACAFAKATNSPPQGSHGVFVGNVSGNGVISELFTQMLITQPSDNLVHPDITGLEFSANGQFLYFTHRPNGTNPNPVEYLNLSTQTRHPLTLAGQNDFAFSHIERATDGKLYMATANRMASITNASTPQNLVWNNNALSVSYSPSQFYGIMNNSGYTLPDQIDGMDYFAHFTSDLECCIANTNYEIKNDYTVTASAVWQPGGNPFTAQIGNGSELTVQQTLRIAPGATLTINNMTLKFAPDARVIIERGNATQSGGRLILNGTTLTADNSCSENPMWLGVEVWGNPSLTQTLTHSQSKQGRLDMNNNSVIEHARIGALASRRASGNSMDNTHNGGLIRTDNSIFRHNHVDVHLRRYGNTNLSRFVNTQFLLTQPLADINAWPQYRVYLLDVQGPLFEGCDFINTAQVYAGLSTGLQSETSRFTVRARCTSAIFPCTSFDRGRFEGFRTGVYATGPSQNATRTAYIDRCDFILNRAGILLNNQLASTVIRNQFTVPKNYSQSYGLHLNRCHGYKVEENNIEEPAPADALSGLTTYGVIVTESGTEHNEIYKNTFGDLRVGVQAQGINGQADLPNNSWRGLQILCNRFIKNIYEADIAVSSGRIDHQQGVFGQYAAGNEFSLNGYTPYNCIWINPNADDINYVHRSTAPHVPQYYDPAKVGVTVYNGGPACPSRIKEAKNISIAGLLVRIAEIEAEENPTEEEKQERLEAKGNLLRAVNHMEEFTDSTDLVYTSLYGAAATKEQLLAKTDYRVSKGEYTPALNELYIKMSQYGFSTDLVNMRVYAESEAAGFKLTEQPVNWHVYWAEALAAAGPEYEAEGFALLNYLTREEVPEPEIEPLWSEPDPKKGASGSTPAMEAGKVYEVFPNPATDRLTVNMEGAYRAELHSATGGESATAILPEGGTWLLPHNLAAGAYILRVYDQNGSLLHTQAVVKQ